MKLSSRVGVVLYSTYIFAVIHALHVEQVQVQQHGQQLGFRVQDSSSPAVMSWSVRRVWLMTVLVQVQ